MLFRLSEHHSLSPRLYRFLLCSLSAAAADGEHVDPRLKRASLFRSAIQPDARHSVSIQSQSSDLCRGLKKQGIKERSMCSAAPSNRRFFPLFPVKTPPEKHVPARLLPLPWQADCRRMSPRDSPDRICRGGLL